MAGSPTVQRRMTNRIKRQLKSLEYELLFKPKIEMRLVDTIYKFGLMRYQEMFGFYERQRISDYKHKEAKEKVLCISTTFNYRVGRKYGTWLELPPHEQEKQEQRRYKRLLSNMRRYGSTSN